MHNLDQIRAAEALDALRKAPVLRNDIAGLPALILTNGLLATAAYCCEENKGTRAGMNSAFNAIASHLKKLGITRSADGHTLMSELAHGDNFTLQRATSEALAFLAYLKRFAAKKED